MAAKLECEICGGKLVGKPGGVFECDSCGVEYSTEWARAKIQEIRGTVKTRGAANVTSSPNDVARLKMLVQTYMNALDYDEAEKTVKKILAAVPNDVFANKMYRKLRQIRDFEIENGVLVRYHGKAEYVEIPDGVTAIGRSSVVSGVFEGYQKLLGVTIPNSVTKIGERAFGYCEQLTRITLPQNLTQIGHEAFVFCKGLSSITLPESLKQIDGAAFASCTGLSTITIPRRVETLGEHTFSCCTSLTKIILPDSVKSMGVGIFRGCTKLQSVVLPKRLRDIPAYGFEKCQALRLVRFPERPTTLGIHCFENCVSLTEAVIPEGVTEIGDAAFARCIKLQKVVIPSTVRRIGPEAFCTGDFINRDCLKSISIPDQVVRMCMVKGNQFGKHQAEIWRAKGLCSHCGSEFGGLVFKKCKQCFAPKDY